MNLDRTYVMQPQSSHESLKKDSTAPHWKDLERPIHHLSSVSSFFFLKCRLADLGQGMNKPNQQTRDSKWWSAVLDKDTLLGSLLHSWKTEVQDPTESLLHFGRSLCTWGRLEMQVFGNMFSAQCSC
jgi:hypothetical protein